MMKRYFMMFSAAVAALVSCHKEPNLEPVPEPQVESHEVTIEAGILSKTVLDGDAVMWEGSDEIALVFTHTSSAPHVNKTFVNQEAVQTKARALFKGQLPNDVSQDNGYNDLGFAVYPETAIDDDGVFSHNLPATQVAKANGSFPSGCNLSSAALALSEMGEGGSTKTDFRNALSILRVALSADIESVTITGTAPLAGTAPLQMYYNSADKDNVNNGRLLVDAKGTWSDASTSVTLTPADGTTFENKTYNILVWPGKQEGLTITVNYKNIGEYEKVSSISTDKPATFKPAMYYKLNFKNTEELVIEEFDTALGKVEGDVADLVDQIQSVSLVSEYLDNAVKARYSVVGSDYFKQEIELNYMIRPANVAMQLVDKYSDSMSALVSCWNSSGGLDWVTLPINSATFSGDIMTVKVNADAISKSVYDGNVQAQLALQIASSTTDILSDFAKLHPFKGAGLYFTKTEDIPVIKGASLAIPFRYAPSGNDYTLSVSGNQNPTLTDNKGFFSGYINVNIADSDLASQSLTVTLTSGDDVVETQLTFAQGPQFEILDIPQIDWIGGQFSINVNADAAYNPYSLRVEGGTHNNEYNYYTWIKEASEGVSGIYSVEENVTITQDKLDAKGNVVYKKDDNQNDVPVKVTLHNGTQRQATAVFEVKIKDTGSNGDLSYRMTRPIIQKAYGTSYNPDLYYRDAERLTLQTALPGYTPLNIVILGDGYKKKDLIKGGLFESRARSAMGSFFGIEPYKSYQNRFNVYMVAYESAEEGTDSKNESMVKNTYFNTYHSGETQLWFGDGGVDKVKKAVTEVLGLDLYRTISIVLVNTNKDAGTSSQIDLVVDGTSYYGEPYKGFGVACVAANSTGTNGLIKHEAGGHAFGRLADEYLDGDDNIQKSYDGNLTDPHNKGQYRNVTTYKGYWDDLLYYPGYSSVISYVEGGMSCDKGIYRPTTGGMMFNNQGVFNAVCRRIIFERIIRQTEGAGAYSLSKFVEYDTINMPK